MFEIFFNPKIILIVFLVIVIFFYIKKEIKKNKPLNEENEKRPFIRQEINTQQTKKNTEESELNKDDVILKTIKLLEELPTRTDEEINEYNANFFSDVINKNPDIKHDENSIVLSDNEMEKIGNILDKKLGSDVAPFVRRVDKDGTIILSMEAIKFITGDHIPLITPQGSIRVFNFLTLEDDLTLSLESGKPLFILNNETKKIKQIPNEYLQKIVITEDEFKTNQLLDNRRIQIEELTQRNKQLEENNTKYRNQINVLKEELIKIDAEKKVYEKLVNKEIEIPPVNKSNIEASKNNANKNTDILNDVKVKEELIKIDAEKKVYEKLVNKEIEIPPVNKSNIEASKNNANKNTDILNDVKVKEELIKIDAEKKVYEKLDNKEIEIPPVNKSNIEASKNNANKNTGILDDIKIEKDETQSDQKSKEKVINKNSANIIKKTFFNEELLLYSNNKNILPSEITYLSYEKIKFTSEIKIKYILKKSKENLVIFLKSQNYESKKESIQKLFQLLNINIKKDAFFVKNGDKNIYKSDIIEIIFKEDEIYGTLLPNEKSNGYAGGYTLEEYRQMRDATMRNDLKNIYKRIIDFIEKEDFIVIGNNQDED
ncbi:hypothetical protein ACNSOL_11880 (plasmid) [Aliarcobacter lanthieri]|uniref:hypothetical protein n=1 Tax=Aliarcobacter lanthieri TaxID=1355374 RepID=UPI003AAAF943